MLVENNDNFKIFLILILLSYIFILKMISNYKIIKIHHTNSTPLNFIFKYIKY